MTPKMCYRKFHTGTKNAEFYSDFQTFEKVAKRLNQKNLCGGELLNTVLKDVKPHNSFPLFCRKLYATFSTDSESAAILPRSQ
jgi:hypothetical protein